MVGKRSIHHEKGYAGIINREGVKPGGHVARFKFYAEILKILRRIGIIEYTFFKAEWTGGKRQHAFSYQLAAPKGIVSA
jgi:hypothetical protein